MLERIQDYVCQRKHDLVETYLVEQKKFKQYDLHASRSRQKLNLSKFQTFRRLRFILFFFALRRSLVEIENHELQRIDVQLRADCEVKREFRAHRIQNCLKFSKSLAIDIRHDVNIVQRLFAQSVAHVLNLDENQRAALESLSDHDFYVDRREHNDFVFYDRSQDLDSLDDVNYESNLNVRRQARAKVSRIQNLKIDIDLFLDHLNQKIRVVLHENFQEFNIRKRFSLSLKALHQSIDLNIDLSILQILFDETVEIRVEIVVVNRQQKLQLHFELIAFLLLREIK